MVVRMPSSSSPSKMANPLMPVPVPTSTTALAPVAATRVVSSAALVGDGANVLISILRPRACAADSDWVCQASEYDVISALMVNLRKIEMRSHSYDCADHTKPRILT